MELFGEKFLVQGEPPLDLLRPDKALVVRFEIMKEIKIFEKSLDTDDDLITRHEGLGVGHRDGMGQTTFEGEKVTGSQGSQDENPPQDRCPCGFQPALRRGVRSVPDACGAWDMNPLAMEEYP